MAINPVSMGYPGAIQTQQAQKIVAPPQIANKAPEAFEGEAEMLKDLYHHYIENFGGFKEINGQRVHVTTVLHIDSRAQAAMKAVETRLKELGELPA